MDFPGTWLSGLVDTLNAMPGEIIAAAILIFSIVLALLVFSIAVGLLRRFVKARLRAEACHRASRSIRPSAGSSAPKRLSAKAASAGMTIQRGVNSTLACAAPPHAAQSA